jgi:hypothetical protein
MPAPETTELPPEQVDVGHGVVEKLEKGQADETLFLALGGVALVVAAAVAVLLTVTFLVYYLA